MELAVVDADGRLVLETLVRPRRRPSAEARRLHRLDLPELHGAPSFPSIYGRLREVFVGRTVIAYGATFDRRTLDLCCRRYRLPTIGANWECLLTRYQQWRGFRTSLRLACETEGIELGPDLHRAAPDARLAWLLIREMAGPSS